MHPEVVEEVRRGRISPAHILFGEESFGRDDTARAIIEALGAIHGDLDISSFDCTEHAMEDILNAVLTAPMFSPVRCVVIRRLEDLPAKDLERLLGPILRSKEGDGSPIPEETYVIAISASKTLAKVQKAGQWAKVLEFKRVYERDAQAFVFEYGKRLGLRVDREAALELVDLVGPDLRAIATELEKLLSYAGQDRSSISADDVRLAVGHVSKDTVFDLCDAVAAGDKERAIGAYRHLSRSNEPPQMIQSILATHIRQLIQIRCRLDVGLTPSQVMAELDRADKRASFRHRRLTTQAASLRSTDLRLMVTIIARTDLAVKTGAIQADLGMETMLLELCQAAKQKLQ